MAVKCGNHETRTFHETSAEVRQCYAASAVEREATARYQIRAQARRDAYDRLARYESIQGQGYAKVDHATELQKKFIASLRLEHGLDALPFAGTKRQASEEIDRLKKLPKVGGDAKPFPKVADGRYALVEDGVVKFYRVKSVVANNDHTRTFTYLDRQASETYYPVKARGVKQIVLSRIAASPKIAQMLYANELGKCYKCGRTLTDDTSRELGIGPVCRGESE